MKLRHTRRIAAVPAALLVALAIAACGGGSPSSSTSTAAAATNAGGSSNAPASTRFSGIASCLKKNGVTAPAGGFAGGRPRGGATGGSGPAGGSSRPQGGAGARNPAFAAAFAKCRGQAPAQNATGGLGNFNASSSQDRAEITSYVACMKSDGVNLPTPNLSGSGSIFGKGVNTTSAAFRTATGTCKSLLTFLPGA